MLCGNLSVSGNQGSATLTQCHYFDPDYLLCYSFVLLLHCLLPHIFAPLFLFLKESSASVKYAGS
jgi:hypothetical protein